MWWVKAWYFADSKEALRAYQNKVVALQAKIQCRVVEYTRPMKRATKLLRNDLVETTVGRAILERITTERDCLSIKSIKHSIRKMYLS